jgi:integrase
MKRYAPANLRRPDHYTDAFDRLIKPAIGKIGITELKRRHIAELLDAIEDDNGPVMATRALSYVRSDLNWYATRDDIVEDASSRSIGRARPRHTRTIGTTNSRFASFGLCSPRSETSASPVRSCRLTATRRQEAIGMMWTEINEDVWTIPASRYKTGRDHVVPLSAAAQAIIVSQSASGPRVFPGRHGAALSTGRNAGLAPWTVHDLRRTSRSLMSRAEVRPDIAERVLGHAIPGIRGVYDRHEFIAEKRDALERLAALIDRIVNPPPGVVIPLREVR